MIDATTIYSLVKLGRFAFDNLQAGIEGEKTDEEIMSALDEMHVSVKEASAAWRRARET